MTSSIPETHFKSRFGDKEYYFKLSLYNTEGQVVGLKKNALRHLEIIDNIFNPFHSGSIIVTNDSNILERSFTPYTFLGNGRDFLEVEIIPVVTGDFDSDITNATVRKVLGLCFVFIVTETVELLYNNSLCKKLKFVEYGQYLINERYTTPPNIAASSDANATNFAASTTTGDLIKRILRTVFSGGKETDDIFCVDDDKKIIFDTNSETDTNIKIYGSTPLNQTLNYAINAHTDTQGSPCILQFDRGLKKFKLQSLNRIFKNHAQAKSLVETLVFPSTDSKQQSNINFNYCVHTFKESLINEFFTESPTAIYGIDLLASETIASFSRQYNTFIYDTKSLNKQNFIETYFNLFCKPFESLFPNYGIVPNFYLNPERTNQTTVESAHTANLSKKISTNQKLKAMLFLGYIYKFKLTGLTNRQSTLFCDVIRNDKSSDSIDTGTWDKNTLGRHLVTTVRHIFTQDLYINEIETVKPYRLTNQGTQLGDFLKSASSILNTF